MRPVPLTAFKVVSGERVVMFHGQNPLDLEPQVIVVPFGAMMLAAAQVIQQEGATEMARHGHTARKAGGVGS